MGICAPQFVLDSSLDQFPGISQTKLVGMFWSFFDEAGGADHQFIAVCGWLAEREAWKEFEADWKAMLARFDVPYFHMKEVAQFRGPFAKWYANRAERDEFIKEAARLIRETVEMGVLVVVRYDAWRSLNLRYDLEKQWRSPYVLASRFCIARANAWVREQGYTERDVQYFFEDGGPDMPGLVALAKRDALQIPAFRSGRDTELEYGLIPLQAADFLAYEVRKAVVDHPDKFTQPEEFRKSFQAFFNCDVDQGNYGEPELRELCEALKVPERIP